MKLQFHETSELFILALHCLHYIVSIGEDREGPHQRKQDGVFIYFKNEQNRFKIMI